MVGLKYDFQMSNHGTSVVPLALLELHLHLEPSTH